MPGTPIAGRSRPLRRLPRRPPGPVKALLAVSAALALAFGSMLGLAATSPAPVAARSGPPVLAYYYMWFNAQSWAQRKTDLPTLGAYDSANPDVIRQQVAWAKAAGIDALIASWKQTPNLDEALAELVQQCHEQGMKLVVIYEGLDVNRNPIPAATVGADLAWFVAHYGSDPVFDVFGKPAVIWSGTWKFSSDEIAGVRRQAGAPDSLLLLGSEKDAASYAAKASLFDGDAYYWSSADPLSTPGYAKRLGDLSAAVHADHGLWLAPAAVGFDARLNGGTSIVDRRAGATLRAAWSAAQATNPDGIAVISWNEYTENSYIEPSRNYGSTYVNVLASLTGGPGIATIEPSAGGASSSPPSAPPTPSPSASSASGLAPPSGVAGSNGAAADRFLSILVAGLVIFAIVLLAVLARRRRSPTKRHGIARWLAGIGLAIVVAAIVFAWLVPNVAGAQFVEVRPVLSAVSSPGGPVVTLGGRSTHASAVSIRVEVVNHYPLPVVVGVPDVAFRAAVYLRTESGQLDRVWETTAGDPAIEEGSDSPGAAVGQAAVSAAVVAAGTTRFDLSSGGANATFSLISNGTARAAGVYYVRVWAYGIAGDLVPLAIDAG